jgi:hypothetical protein
MMEFREEYFEEAPDLRALRTVESEIGYLWRIQGGRMRIPVQ